MSVQSNAHPSIEARQKARTVSPGRAEGRSAPSFQPGMSLGRAFDQWLETIAPAPWSMTVGVSTVQPATQKAPRPLYSEEERVRRDRTVWTIVQAVLAPLQFVVFAISLALVLRFVLTGQGYGIATASIIVKTVLLYAIMITGSIWEKVVFGKWLFAPSFFWEDVFSMLVLTLQTAYLFGVITGRATHLQQMEIALAAYAAYAINATQFLLKLRQARLEKPAHAVVSGQGA